MTGAIASGLLTLSIVIPDGSRKRADPGPGYPGIASIWCCCWTTAQGYMGPGSRA